MINPLMDLLLIIMAGLLGLLIMCTMAALLKYWVDK